MVEIVKSTTFDQWLCKLRDRKARARIEMRIRRLSLGHFGDVTPIGNGLSELRIKHGPGYRVYFMQRSSMLLVLLCGGDKRTQRADIERAKKIAAQWKE